MMMKTISDTNYCTKTYINTTYYDKTYINTNYYDRVSVDFLLNTPSKPNYSGYISAAGAINRNNGFYTFTVNKTATGTYQILFDVTASTSNYSVVCTPRVSIATFCTYSGQGSAGFIVYTRDISGTLADYGFSFIVVY